MLIIILGKTKQNPLDKKKKINFTGISYKLYFNHWLKSESTANVVLTFNPDKGLRLLAHKRAHITSDLYEEKVVLFFNILILLTFQRLIPNNFKGKLHIYNPIDNDIISR